MTGLVWELDASGVGRWRAENGGSQPLAKTLTAADVSAGWDSEAGYAAVEWADYDADTFALIVAELENTLDGDLLFVGLYAFDSGATTADVINNGESLASADPAVISTYTSAYPATNVVQAGSLIVTSLVAGKAAYIVYSGTTPPTTGSATIRALRLT